MCVVDIGCEVCTVQHAHGVWMPMLRLVAGPSVSSGSHRHHFSGSRVGPFYLLGSLGEQPVQEPSPVSPSPVCFSP